MIGMHLCRECGSEAIDFASLPRVGLRSLANQALGSGLGVLQLASAEDTLVFASRRYV